jgi:hypothetical protein
LGRWKLPKNALAVTGIKTVHGCKIIRNDSCGTIYINTNEHYRR